MLGMVRHGARRPGARLEWALAPQSVLGLFGLLGLPVLCGSAAGAVGGLGMSSSRSSSPPPARRAFGRAGTRLHLLRHTERIDFADHSWVRQRTHRAAAPRRLRAPAAGQARPAPALQWPHVLPHPATAPSHAPALAPATGGQNGLAIRPLPDRDGPQTGGAHRLPADEGGHLSGQCLLSPRARCRVVSADMPAGLLHQACGQA